MSLEKSKVSRRGFLLQSSAISSSLLLGADSLIPDAIAENSPIAAATHSDVGSLFPLIESEAVQSYFPLSYLSPRFKNIKRWKKTARSKLLELLHYTPKK